MSIPSAPVVVPGSNTTSSAAPGSDAKPGYDASRAPPTPLPLDCAAALESLSCPICCDLLLAPVVTPCGHAYCRDCFEAWRLHAAGTSWHPASRLHCPVCRAPLPRSLAHPHTDRGCPLAPCAPLADAVALLCPARLSERQRQLEVHRHGHQQHGGGAGIPAAGGGHGGLASGAGGDGGLGHAVRRRLVRWLAAGWRRLVQLRRRLPSLEDALALALIGLYAGVGAAMVVQTLDHARVTTNLCRSLMELAQGVGPRRGGLGCRNGGGGGGIIGGRGAADGRGPWPWRWPEGWPQRPHAGLLPALWLPAAAWPFGRFNFSGGGRGGMWSRWPDGQSGVSGGASGGYGWSSGYGGRGGWAALQLEPGGPHVVSQGTVGSQRAQEGEVARRAAAGERPGAPRDQRGGVAPSGARRRRGLWAARQPLCGR